MKIYTSYYANLKRIDPEKYIFVAVSQGVPKWFRGYHLAEVAPSWEMVSAMRIDKTRDKAACEYLECVLGQLCPRHIRERLESISGGKMLCCFVGNHQSNFAIDI